MEKILFWDERIFFFANKIVGKFLPLDFFLKFLGVYLIYFVPVILIILWFWSEKIQKIALRAFASGVFGWIVLDNLISYFFYRSRPFVSQFLEKELIFHRPDKSFPSDHTTFLIALGLSFYLAGQKKLASLFLILAIIISITRVIAGVHWPLDMIAGFGTGAVSAFLFFWLSRPIDFILLPIIKIAQKLHLG